MERNRSVLANASAPLPGYNAVHDGAGRGGLSEKSTNVDGPPEEHGSYAPDLNLTQEQVQMFEKGNQDMMTHYQMTLDKVRYVTRALSSASQWPTISNPPTQNRRAIPHRDREPADRPRE